MNRCLNERALLRIYTHEGTAAEQSHVRRCADCAEHYERLVEDLAAIGQALETPPLAEGRGVVPWRVPWVPVAIACAALAVLVLDVAWLRRPEPVQVAARPSSVSAFAADLSAALFATADTGTGMQLAAEAPYLVAALSAGQPCTRERYLNGECSDELSAFLIEDE